MRIRHRVVIVIRTFYPPALIRIQHPHETLLLMSQLPEAPGGVSLIFRSILMFNKA